MLYELQPFKSGLASETEDGKIVIYDKDQFPRIEVFAAVDDAGNYTEDDTYLKELAESVCFSFNDNRLHI